MIPAGAGLDVFARERIAVTVSAPNEPVAVAPALPTISPLSPAIEPSARPRRVFASARRRAATRALL